MVYRGKINCHDEEITRGWGVLDPAYPIGKQVICGTNLNPHGNSRVICE